MPLVEGSNNLGGLYLRDVYTCWYLMMLRLVAKMCG